MIRYANLGYPAHISWLGTGERKNDVIRARANFRKYLWRRTRPSNLFGRTLGVKGCTTKVYCLLYLALLFTYSEQLLREAHKYVDIRTMKVSKHDSIRAFPCRWCEIDHVYISDCYSKISFNLMWFLSNKKRPINCTWQISRVQKYTQLRACHSLHSTAFCCHHKSFKISVAMCRGWSIWIHIWNKPICWKIN